MRLKGINPIERHAEKLFAALFALALLGVLAWQFLTPAANVKVGAREVGIQDAYKEVATLAMGVDTGLKSPSPAVPTEAQVQEVTKRIDNFEATLKASISPNPALRASLDKPNGLDGGSDLLPPGSQDTAMNEVKIPAPEHPMAAPYIGAVASSEAQVPEVAKILPPSQPFDKAAVTVEATFNGADLRKAFELDPDGTGPMRAVPTNWWQSGVQILAVELTRQMLKPDGTWSAPEKVKGMPGRPLNVDTADTLNDAESLKAAIKLAAEQPDMVRRTPYYLIAKGEEWTPPSERDLQQGAAALNKAARIKQLQDDLKRNTAKKKTLEDQIAKLGQGGGPRPAPGGAGGGGGGGRLPGGAGGGGGGGGAAPPGGGSADDARKKGLQTQLDKVKQERAKIVDELRDLGETVEGEPNQQSSPVSTDTGKTKTEIPVLDNASIRVWAHDVFVERGKTYRYQVALVLTNPYFGHSAAMKTEQAEKLAKSGVMRSPASEWTAPVSVDPETYVYFTSATEDDPITGSSASARIEVYQFKWGFWRRSDPTSLEPGDRVAAEIKVPDFSKVMPAAPAPDVPPPTPAGPGRGGHAAAPSGPTGGHDATTAANAKIPSETITVVRDEIVLSVGHGPSRASAGRSPEVFIRESGGDVRIIEPDVEKADPAYVRVSKSADRGQHELAPPSEKARPNTPQNPSAPEPDRDRRPGGAPSGG